MSEKKRFFILLTLLGLSLVVLVMANHLAGNVVVR